MKFSDVFVNKLPIIGMIHLPPLLGYPKSPGMTEVISKALGELKMLEDNGVDGVMVENEHDQPHKVTVGPETIAAMAVVTKEVVINSKRAVVGAEILLNDPKASLAVAKAAGARFIRTDYFVDRMKREEYGGEMIIDPKGIIKYRQNINAEDVLILADIQVKYAEMLETKSIAQSAKQAMQEGADAVIVTGKLTGSAPVIDDIRMAREAISDKNYPILIGSGLVPENANEVFRYADGAIVGTGLKTGTNMNDTIDPKKVKGLIQIVNEIRKH